MYTRAGTTLLILTVVPPSFGGQEPEQLLRAIASDSNLPPNDLAQVIITDNAVTCHHSIGLFCLIYDAYHRIYSHLDLHRIVLSTQKSKNERALEAELGVRSLLGLRMPILFA